MSQYTFQFNDLAAYASAKASGGSIAAALSGVSSTDISRSVVSYIKGIGQAVTDSVNLFVPYAKGGLAGDVLYYTGTEYCWLKSPSDALDGSVLGQNIINTSAIPTSWVRVGAVPTSESKDVQIGMQAYQPGAAMVKVEKLLGNSVAWNQGVSLSNQTKNINGVQVTINNSLISYDGTASSGGGRTLYFNGVSQNISLITGHKIYSVNTTGQGLYITSRSNTTTYKLIGQGETIFTVVTGFNDGGLGLNTTLNSEYHSSGYIFLIDLTLMFGESAANTMTVEMFEKLFPLSYYDYNPGEIISNEAVAVKGIGRNVWDEEWEVGTILPATGKNYAANDRIRSKNYIKVFPNTTYYFRGAIGFLYFYDVEKNFISCKDTSASNIGYTMPVGCYYLRFIGESSYGPIYNHDICISLSGPLNGTYEPYKESIAKLDAKKIYGKLNGTGNYVQVFPDGIRSAGTAYDEVDYQSKSAVVRVDSVDLGSLSWGSSDNTRFYSSSLNSLMKFPTSNAGSANGLCSKYGGVVSYSGHSEMDKVIFTTWVGASAGLSVRVNDSSYSDAATFKAAMAGVELLYELATPKYYTDLKLSDDNGATFHDLPRPFYYTAGLEMKDPQDTASSVTAPARILAQYKPIKK